MCGRFETAEQHQHRVLTFGRNVGAKEKEDDSKPFKEKDVAPCQRTAHPIRQVRETAAGHPGEIDAPYLCVDGNKCGMIIDMFLPIFQYLI